MNCVSFKCSFIIDLYSPVFSARIFMDHYKTSHGRGQNGTEDDLILLTDVMKEIDTYEAQNNLQLGPPLLSTLEHGGVTKKFSNSKEFDLEDSKGNLWPFLSKNSRVPEKKFLIS